MGPTAFFFRILYSFRTRTLFFLSLTFTFKQYFGENVSPNPPLQAYGE